jgi:hypothetical protein
MNNMTVEQQAGEGCKELLGTFRRFQSGGPVYEVVAIKDERTATIHVVESGEELDYPIDKILDDDEA